MYAYFFFAEMLSGGYFGVISPEGAASILGRYKDDKHKLEQFPKDCQELATAQCIYAHQLQALGVVDEIIWEEEPGAAGAESARETYKSFPKLRARIESFLRASLLSLIPLSTNELVQQRYGKYRKLGTFSILDEAERTDAVETAKKASASTKKRPLTGAETSKPAVPYSLLSKHLAEEVVLGERSKYRKMAPPSLNTPLTAAPIAALTAASTATAATRTVSAASENSAKYILDTHGATYMCREWLPKQKRVLVTDTTMRDAHQSLLATRVRTKDVVAGAEIASKLLGDAFSLECWGGATFGQFLAKVLVFTCYVI